VDPAKERRSGGIEALKILSACLLLLVLHYSCLLQLQLSTSLASFILEQHDKGLSISCKAISMRMHTSMRTRNKFGLKDLVKPVWRLISINLHLLIIAMSLIQFFCRAAVGIRCLHLTRVREMSSQITNRVMMIRPGLFRANPSTVADNAFQSAQKPGVDDEVHSAALKEFNAYAGLIQREGIEVDIIDDTQKLPDAVFPNNWISFHSPREGESEKPIVMLYPMMSLPRRKEAHPSIINYWVKKLGAEIKDYRKYEEDGLYLEGTGSMVLDRVNHIVYACLSKRTSELPLKQFCSDFKCELVSFKANSISQGVELPIYHTNVLMSVGTTFAIICVDSIMDMSDRERVCKSLAKTGKAVIPISEQQMWSFAGNVLQLQSADGHSVVAMSTQAYKSLTEKQLQLFADHSCSVIHSDLSTLEKYGGGGARCMIAEVFPPL
jgi:hypothetical protein